MAASAFVARTSTARPRNTFAALQSVASIAARAVVVAAAPIPRLASSAAASAASTAVVRLALGAAQVETAVASRAVVSCITRLLIFTCSASVVTTSAARPSLTSRAREVVTRIACRALVISCGLACASGARTAAGFSACPSLTLGANNSVACVTCSAVVGGSSLADGHASLAASARASGAWQSLADSAIQVVPWVACCAVIVRLALILRFTSRTSGA
jgi:hypothetical protein